MTIRSTIVLLLTALLAMQLDGQDAEDSKFKPAPIEVTSDTMVFDMEAKRCDYTGNVKVVDDQFILTADEISAFLDEDFQIETIDATGHVVINHGGNKEATGGTAQYDAVKNVATLLDNPKLYFGTNSGEGANKIVFDRVNGLFTASGRTKWSIEQTVSSADGIPDPTGTPTITMITCDDTVFDMTAKICTFTGDVRVDDPRFTMKSEVTVAHLNDDMEVKRIESKGNIEIIHDKNKATGGKAVYNVDEDTVVLTEAPEVFLGENHGSGGTRVVYNRESGHFKAEGGFVWRIHRKDSDKKLLMPE